MVSCPFGRLSKPHKKTGYPQKRTTHPYVFCFFERRLLACTLPGCGARLPQSGIADHRLAFGYEAIPELHNRACPPGHVAIEPIEGPC